MIENRKCNKKNRNQKNKWQFKYLQLKQPSLQLSLKRNNINELPFTSSGSSLPKPIVHKKSRNPPKHIILVNDRIMERDNMAFYISFLIALSFIDSIHKPVRRKKILLKYKGTSSANCSQRRKLQNLLKITIFMIKIKTFLNSLSKIIFSKSKT